MSEFNQAPEQPPDGRPIDVSAPVSVEKAREAYRHRTNISIKDGAITTVPPYDINRTANHVMNVLRELGLNIDEPSLKETPTRVVKFLLEFCQPCDLVALLKRFDHEDSRDYHSMPMVVVQDIPLAAICEHHLCPFFGTIDIGYIPHGNVVGLSKMARLVHAAGRTRPTIQETLTNDIANSMDEALSPKGVMVVARATHTCMSVRGIATPGVITTTSAIRGAFVHVPAAREEFFSLLRR